MTNQGFLFIMLVIYEKTLTKTVGYILKSKRVRDGAVSYTHLDVYKRQGVRTSKRPLTASVMLLNIWGVTLIELPLRIHVFNL